MTIPILDFATYDADDPAALRTLASQLDEALTSYGFIAITNLGIDPSLRDRAFASAKQFFAQARDDKLKCAYRDSKANFGYHQPLSETLEPGLPADLKEAFTMRDLVSHYGTSDEWPSVDFMETARAYFDACMAAAMRVLHVFCRSGSAAGLFCQQTFRRKRDPSLRALPIDRLRGQRSAADGRRRAHGLRRNHLAVSGWRQWLATPW